MPVIFEEEEEEKEKHQVWCYIQCDSIAWMEIARSAGSSATKEYERKANTSMQLLTYVEHTARRGNAKTKLSRVKKIAMVLSLYWLCWCLVRVAKQNTESPGERSSSD